MSTFVTSMPPQTSSSLGALAASLDLETDVADVASWLQRGHVASSFSLARVFGRTQSDRRPDPHLRARLTPGQRIVDLRQD